MLRHKRKGCFKLNMNKQMCKNRIFPEALIKTQLYKVHYFLTGSIGELLIASPHSMTVDQKVDKT